MPKVSLAGWLPPVPGPSPPPLGTAPSPCRTLSKLQPRGKCPGFNFSPAASLSSLPDRLCAQAGEPGSWELRLQSHCSSRSSSPRCSSPPACLADRRLTEHPIQMGKSQIQAKPLQRFPSTAGVRALWGSEHCRAPTAWSPVAPAEGTRGDSAVPEHSTAFLGNPETWEWGCHLEPGGMELLQGWQQRGRTTWVREQDNPDIFPKSSACFGFKTSVQRDHAKETCVSKSPPPQAGQQPELGITVLRDRDGHPRPPHPKADGLTTNSCNEQAGPGSAAPLGLEIQHRRLSVGWKTQGPLLAALLGVLPQLERAVLPPSSPRPSRGGTPHLESKNGVLGQAWGGQPGRTQLTPEPRRRWREQRCQPGQVHPTLQCS